MRVFDANGDRIVDVPYDILGEAVVASNTAFVDDAFMRIVFLDNNYKYFSIANIERIIDEMHDSGLNYLMLGFGGSGRGLSFKLDNMTVHANGVDYDLSNCISTNFGDYYTEADMRTIMAYAKQNGVEIIPSFNMPGHFAPFLVYHPEFRYNGDANSVDINNDAACNYAFAIEEMYVKWFAANGARYWHMGADEFGDIVNGYYNLYASGNYRYAEFINHAAYIAAKYRMIPTMWNDPICIENDPIPHINRNVPVFFWTLRPQHGSTPVTIKSEGHKLVNSSASIYWVAGPGQKVTEQQMRSFRIDTFDDGSVVTDGVIGACFCVWIGLLESPALDDDGDAITNAILPLIAAFGETIAAQINA